MSYLMFENLKDQNLPVKKIDYELFDIVESHFNAPICYYSYIRWNPEIVKDFHYISWSTKPNFCESSKHNLDSINR